MQQILTSQIYRASVLTTLLYAFLSAGLHSPATRAAEGTIYVSDVFYVPLYSGKSTKHRIVHRGIKSGAALTVLDRDNKAGFTKVGTSSGIEGWIQNQYVSETPVARIQLRNERQQLASMREKLDTVSSSNKSISQTKLIWSDR